MKSGHFPWAIIAADCLTKIVTRAQPNDLFLRLAPDKGVSMMQHVDGIVLCLVIMLRKL